MDWPSGDQAGSRSIDAGSIGDVARGPVLGGNGEDFAMRLKGGTQAGRGDRCVFDLVGDALDVGAYLGQIGIDLDRDDMTGGGSCVVEVNFAQAVVDEGAAIAGERADVGTIVGQSFGDGLAQGS